MDLQMTEGLLRKFISGEKEAEETIVTYLQEKIEWLVYKKIGRRNPQSEDLASEILAIIITNIKTGKYSADKGDLGGYAYSIARNKIVDFLNSVQYQKRKDIKRLDDAEILGEIEVIHGRSLESQQDELEHEELKEYLAKQIDSLPDRHKRVLYLSFYEGFSSSEISEKLGLPAKKVSELKNYGLKLLREKMEKSFQYF
jgi:RNA polymerase sigma factor (sigma-70 family)